MKTLRDSSIRHCYKTFLLIPGDSPDAAGNRQR